MFNMDETHVTSKTLYTVWPRTIVNRSFVQFRQCLTLRTVVITVRGGRERLKPLTIIPKKKTLSGNLSR